MSPNFVPSANEVLLVISNFSTFAWIVFGMEPLKNVNIPTATNEKKRMGYLVKVN